MVTLWLRYYGFARRMGQPRRWAWRDAFYYCSACSRPTKGEATRGVTLDTYDFGGLGRG